jgi:glycosyltransferase involved in cell wall biosynthesis
LLSDDVDKGEVGCVSASASIAVVILTYNEELHLTRALEHVAGFAKEIFVVDSFSTDATVRIAEDFGAQVLQHPFQNYAKQFNWALEHAPVTAEWVMRLDADEIVEEDLAEEIRRKLPNLPKEVTGVNLKRKTIFQGKFIRHGGRYPLTLLRIWRHGKARIEDRWMDEHNYLIEGNQVTFDGGFVDDNLRDLTFFTNKHNWYASREALQVLLQRMGIAREELRERSELTVRQAVVKRQWKENFYNHVPYELASLSYFLYRYLLQLGFLDGREGLLYHVLQGFWYRFLVGAKLRELERLVLGIQDKQTLKDTLEKVTRQKIDLS